MFLFRSLLRAVTFSKLLSLYLNLVSLKPLRQVLNFNFKLSKILASGFEFQTLIIPPTNLYRKTI